VRVGRPPDLPKGVLDGVHAGHVEQRHVLPRKAGLRPVLVDGRRTHGERAPERPDELRNVHDRLLLTAGDGFNDRARERDAAREREARPRRLPQSDRLRAEQRFLVRLLERDDALHQSTATSPAPPSTRTRPPSGISPVPSRVPTTLGIPYSREMIAACESRPPASVTIAPSSGSRMLNASVVDSVTSTSPCTMRSNSDGPETRRAGPSYTPPLAARPRSRFSSCAASELPNSSPKAIPIACMTRATPGGRPAGSGGGGGGGPSDGGASLAVRELRSAKRCASSSAVGPPVPVTNEHISSKP